MGLGRLFRRTSQSQCHLIWGLKDNQEAENKDRRVFQEEKNHIFKVPMCEEAWSVLGSEGG